MTTSDHRKVFKQLRSKPEKLAKFIKFNSPKERSCGKSLRRCKRCNRAGGHIRSYDPHLCRQCFRETATKIGFKKYN